MGQAASLILNAAEKASPDSLLCGTHHAVQLAGMDPQLINPASSVKIVWPLGANVYDGIFEDLRGKFPNLMFVGNLLAMSEVMTPVAVSFNQKNLGGLFSTVDALKFVNPETGEAVGPYAVGEFAVKVSFSVMLGYLNHEEENDHFFGKDGFLYLGDFGHYDENGVIYFDGRKKDLIKYKNTHLYPRELEDLIMKHPDVEDVAVFGNPEPSVHELVTAVVVLANGSKVMAEEIIRQVEENVDDSRKLRGGVFVVDIIPRNPQGKILRRYLSNLIV